MFALLFGLWTLGRPSPAQMQPPACAVVTADQLGPDGKNAAAIQQHLDSCNTPDGAAKSVELSGMKGTDFISGPLYVPSNVVLWLDAGVTLHASTDPADFQRTADARTRPCDSSSAIPICGSLDASNTGCQALINGCQVANAGVGGPGTIEGHGWSALASGPNAGSTWWALAGVAKAGGYVQSLNAPKMINFQRSTNVTLSGFTIHNAPMVHILIGRTTGASVSQVTIITPTADRASSAFPSNSDGLDISGSSDIRVDGVDFSDGDDNVALKAGSNGPVTNVTVTNSVFRLGHGLSIGSETNSGVTNLTASNITFTGTDNGLRIKSDASRGGLVDQIRYSRVCMGGVKNPIVIDPYYSTAVGSLLPLFKSVEVGGMYADGGNLLIRAYTGQPPLALTLNNVRVDGPGTVTASCANITEISDPAFPFPVAIPSDPGGSVTQTQAPAAPPRDIKSYCQAALDAIQGTGASTVSAASFWRYEPVAPDSIVAVFGTGLAQSEAGATALPLPTTLAGSSISITDASGAQHAAGLFAASPGQINAHIPAGLPEGPAILTVTTSDGKAISGPLTLAPVVPGLFSANSNGAGAAAAQLVIAHADGSQTLVATFQCDSAGGCTAAPLDLGSDGDTPALVLYATGLRNSPLSGVTVNVGRVSLAPFYAGPTTMVGLDQVNVYLPRSLAGSGGVNVSLTAGGVASNAVTVNFR